jgi:hypothetical protein
MNLLKLSKEIQELLREGIANIFVWKVKRSWNYKIFWYEDPANDIYSTEDLKEIEEIKKIDNCYLELNGYNDFLDYTLSYIKDRIIKQYEINQEQINGKVPKLQIKLLKIIEDNQLKNKLEIINNSNIKEKLDPFYRANVNLCEMATKNIENNFLLEEHRDITNYIQFINKIINKIEKQK